MKLRTYDTVFECDNCLQSYCKTCFEYAHDDSCAENKRKLKEEEEFEENYKKDNSKNCPSCPFCLNSTTFFCLTSIKKDKQETKIAECAKCHRKFYDKSV